MRRVLPVVVALLALVGVGASVHHYMDEPYNRGFTQFPWITAVHVTLGGLYLALAPLQFVPRIRARAIGYHRRAGRVLVAIGLLVGASAFFIAVVIPFSGLPEQLIVGGFALFFTGALARGFLSIRAGQVDLHREWMMRAFSIGLGIATMRLIFIPALIAVGSPTDAQVRLLSIVSFTLAFIIQVAAAELWIRHTRPHSRGVAAQPARSPA